MESKEFSEWLSKITLTERERVHVWHLFKTEDKAKALAYVREIESKWASLRHHLTLREAPVPYQIWGEDFIDKGALSQMAAAARLPVAVAGALMPDAHQGYGLPIGGVLATDNAVIPYAVGVDIACRMMLTVYPLSAKTDHLYQALLNNTFFGSGLDGVHGRKLDHPLLDKSHWKISKLTLGLRDIAIHQLGTSGGGNHFVEWGELEISTPNNPLHLAEGTYLGLLSHSGSRGVGLKIANHYTHLAMAQMPDLDPTVKHLAWLPLDQDVGREYWESMELAGAFASACHHVIHQQIATAAGLTSLASVENHHNFAWREKITLNGAEKEVIVHRKGATPAGKGVLGIIPGTMADPGYVVIGKANNHALNSASHGSGRLMNRSTAKNNITPEQLTTYLKSRGVHLIGGGLDEAPQAYKPINSVMEAQKDLVDIIGKFQPKIVRMAAEHR